MFVAAVTMFSAYCLSAVFCNPSHTRIIGCSTVDDPEILGFRMSNSVSSLGPEPKDNNLHAAGVLVGFPP